jgi:hypothetical protein
MSCRHPLLNGFPDRCYYHSKLEGGLLADKGGKWWATPAERPKIPPMRDGWTQADADVFAYLLAWGPI